MTGAASTVRKYDRHTAAGLDSNLLKNTLRWIRSAANAGNRSNQPSAQRYSIATFWASTYPASFKPSRNAPAVEKQLGDAPLKGEPQ
jgi:hypothetical protein